MPWTTGSANRPQANSPSETLPTPRQAATDIAVVAGVSIAHGVASLAGLPVGWIVSGVGVVLTAYVLFVLRRRKEPWRAYGFRADNLRQAGWRVGLWTGAVAILIILASRALGNSLDRPELLLLLPLYPLWGILQQFVFQGIVHRALLRLIDQRNVALGISAILFATVHIPFWPVVGLTLGGGLCWSWFYQRWPNLWVLGISHGVLGSLAYSLLLGRNTLEQVF